jgi:septal ring factor EnvC (AmiA/AmiB activator)
MTAPFPRVLPLLLLALLTLAAGLSKADDSEPSATETRLRAALRDTVLQLRDAQNQIVTLQTAQAQSDKDNADLKAKVDALEGEVKSLTDQAAANKASSEKAIADLNSQVSDLTGQNDRLNDAVKQWKNAYDQASQLATGEEAERARLAQQAAQLQRLVEDREQKNIALFKLGNEILTRYDQFSLGEALGAKEPFVGVARIKLETLVQDYRYKLQDQAFVPGQPLAPPITPPKAAPVTTAAASTSHP